MNSHADSFNLHKMTQEPPVKRLNTATEPHPATIFESLCLQADEIRLVEIVPGSRKDALNLKMGAWPLSQSPPFTALSYTWGGAKMTSPVCVNDTEFLLMPNVKAFFDEILSRAGRSYVQLPRHEWMTTRFWIDSICINQSDDDEKKSQVALMKQIFERAEKVLTWLGPVNEEGDHGTDGENTSVEEGGGEEEEEEEEFLEEASEDDEAFNKRFRAMTYLPYWTRAWVIQEASTPHRKRNAIVWWGKKSLQLDTVVGEVLMISDSTASGTLALHSGLDTFRLLAAIKIQRKWAGPSKNAGLTEAPSFISIYTLFSCMRAISSTDPRDRIYALLPLTNMAHIKDLAPDYRISVESLYQKVATCMIREEKSLNIIGFGGQARNLKLPSWVPDWTLASPARAFPRCSLDATGGRYKNLYRASSVEFDGFVDEEQGQLRVRGIKVDTIQACSSARLPAGALEHMDYSMDNDDDVDDDIWVEFEWKLFVLRRTSAYITGCSWREALAHTLCADLKDDLLFEKVYRGGACQVPELGKLTGVLPEGRQLVRDVTMWRRLFDTTAGYLGLGLRDVQQGDSVCILNGCQFPMVLRQHGEFWKVVGEAYVHGLMDGEADALGLDSETFVIV